MSGNSPLKQKNGPIKFTKVPFFQGSMFLKKLIEI